MDWICIYTLVDGSSFTAHTERFTKFISFPVTSMPHTKECTDEKIKNKNIDIYDTFHTIRKPYNPDSVGSIEWNQIILHRMHDSRNNPIDNSTVYEHIEATPYSIVDTLYPDSMSIVIQIAHTRNTEHASFHIKQQSNHISPHGCTYAHLKDTTQSWHTAWYKWYITAKDLITTLVHK